MQAPALARRGVLWPFWLMTVATSALALGLHFASVSTGWQWTPWLLGIAVMGLPHGAQDERLFARERSGGLRARIILLGFYAVGVMLVICLWRLNPRLALLSFLVLAGFHFGEGDLAWSRDFGAADYLTSEWYASSLLVLRGALPILLPIIAFPTSFASVASSLPGISLSLPAETRWIVWVFALLAALIAFQIAYLVRAVVRHSITKRVAFEEISDTLLMSILFVSLPPLLSVGIYFLFAHSHRYIARRIFTLHTEGKIPKTMPEYFAKLWRFHKRTLWVSAGMIALLPLLWLALRKSHWTFDETGPALLVALNALTLPHAVLVWYSDHRSRHFRSSSALLFMEAEASR